MSLELNKVYHGFKFLEEKNIPEVNSIGRLFYHEKSGARLLFLENDDDNKVFSIAFRTTPTDSTGVPHIMEHSVLCGSDKFPTKEPFVELIKGSLNTFLNAMTYPDKTVYPVASRNDKDFDNLMNVYLDAVLHPNIYKYPEILMQEGWHYHLENKEDELIYKGVVYNEMKGAFSSPESVLFRAILHELYPSTTYAVESGGDPECIPDLTYENFIAFHKKYYHPSNSYIFLYGKMNIEEKLKFIDENYLYEYDKIEVDSDIAIEEPFKEMRETTIEYPIGEEEKEEDKTFLSLSFAAGKAGDTEFALAFDILNAILLDNNASPLKKAIIDAGIAKDIINAFEVDMKQPMFTIIAKNSNEDQKERFKEVVFSTLRDLVKNGIDKKLIEAFINKTEFSLREAEYYGSPKGLFYDLKVLSSWLYEESPYAYLEYEEPLKNIKKALTTNYFEDMIEKYLLNNNHCVSITVVPKKGLGERKAAELRTKLKAYKENLSEDELNKIVEDTRRLKARQESVDTEENLRKIPLLKIEDIDKNPEKIDVIHKEIEGIKVLHNDLFTNKIAYLHMYFDSSCVEEELIPYLNLLTQILGAVSTKNYSYEELVNEINIYTGGINFGSEIYQSLTNKDELNPKFYVAGRAMTDKISKLIHLIKEVILNTNLNDEKRLKEIISEVKSRKEAGILNSGHVAAGDRVSSYFSKGAKYNDISSGLGYYKFLCDLENNFETKKDEIIGNLTKVYNKIFNKFNLVISVVVDEKEYVDVENSLKDLLKDLKYEEFKGNTYNFELKPLNEGFTTSAKVQYVAKGYDFNTLGYKYTGNLQVLRTIASYDYLWNKVRVMGGAYGCFARFTRDGKMVASSYRDPNLVETLKAYDDMYKYLDEFKADEREMTKYIIGTISNFDMPKTPIMKGRTCIDDYFRNISYEMQVEERKRILSTNVESIKAMSPLVKECMEKNYLCVIGNEEKIKENKDKFNNILPLFD